MKHSVLVSLGLAVAIGLGTGGSCQDSMAQEPGVVTLAHEMELADPVFPSDPARLCQVIQSKDQRGFTVGYSFALSTPVCMDGKCRILEVTLYWNALGYYERLEYPPGKPLTKKEHDPFTPDDYVKLDRILKDRNSLHRNHSLAFLVEHAENAEDVAPDVDGVDAWTGPTPVTMLESVVQDAAYTTWALWRWANGPITERLLLLTVAETTPEYLNYLLHHSGWDHVDFALKYVVERYPTDGQFTEAMLYVLENSNRPHATIALGFLKKAIADENQRHARLLEAFGRMRPDRNPLILENLAAEAKLSPETLEGLTSQLGGLPYYQVHLILNVLENRDYHSEKTVNDVARLLDGENFFIARRAFEHLSRQDLSEQTQARVDRFREANGDRL